LVTHYEYVISLPGVSSFRTQYFTLSKHRHVSGEPSQRELKRRNSGGAVGACVFGMATLLNEERNGYGRFAGWESYSLRLAW